MLNIHKTVLKAMMFVAFTFSICVISHADNKIQLRLYQPPPNKLGVKDLWKLDITNTSRENINIYLTGIATELKKGLIVSGRSKVFSVKPGKRTYGYDDFKSGEVSWKDRSMQETLLRTGNVVEGEYTICVTAFYENNDVADPEQCIEQTVKQEGSITLISPADGETIPAEQTPTFTWMPSAPDPREAKYSIKIVEVSGNQLPADAMQRNAAWLEKGDIRTTTFQYPNSAKKFEKGKKYVWQVSSGEAKSEGWSISVSIQKVWNLIALTPKNNSTFKDAKEIGDFSWNILGEKIANPQYTIEVQQLDSTGKVKSTYSGKTTETKITYTSIIKDGKLETGQYSWKVKETTMGINSSTMSFSLGSDCVHDFSIDSVDIECLGYEGNKRKFKICFSSNYSGSFQGNYAPLTYTQAGSGLHVTDQAGNNLPTTIILPVSGLLITQPGNPMNTVKYCIVVFAGYSVTAIDFGLIGDDVDPSTYPCIASSHVKIDSLPSCNCKDCDSMIVNFDGLSVTSNGTAGNQFNIGGNISVNVPIYGLEFQIQSYNYSAAPPVCTNGVTGIEQSAMFLMPGTTINGIAAIQVFNETISGSPNTNNNASKNIKLVSTSPMTGNIPVNLIIGLPGPLSGLGSDCCKISYNVCIRVTVFYDNRSCKSCLFTKCFQFTN